MSFVVWMRRGVCEVSAKIKLFGLVLATNGDKKSKRNAVMFTERNGCDVYRYYVKEVRI